MQGGRCCLRRDSFLYSFLHPFLREDTVLFANQQMSILPEDDSARERVGLALLLAFFALSCLPAFLTTLQDNLYTFQAASWLEGKLDINERGTDVAFFKGKLYVPFPPFPAVFLVPMVYLWGESGTNPIHVTLLLTVINLVLLRSILRRCGQTGSPLVWLAAAVLCGTGYWTEAILSSGVWAFAHIVAVTALLLALNESLGCGRGWLIGLCLAAAFLSRQLTLFSSLYFCVALWIREEDSHSRRIFNQFGLWVTVSLGVGIYLVYNWARFGDPFETGYGLLSLSGGLQARFEKYGLFSPVYIPFNFVWFFLQGYQLVFVGEDYLSFGGASPYGTSITFASPFLFLAFMAQWRRSLLWAAWTSIAIILVVFLCYYNNGWVQLNTQRFSLDFIPLMVPLLALGYQRVTPKVWKGLILYSVILNLITVILSCWFPLLG